MSILAFFTWCQNTAMAQTIQGSVWIFPILEVCHLLGLAVLGGAVLLVNMRLMGWGLASQPLEKLARDVRPFLRGSLAMMLVSGWALFMSEAVKCYHHEAFWVKMSFLAAALIFTFAWQNKVTLKGRHAGLGKLTAVISMLLWSGVGVAGRWIGFS